MRAKAVVAAVSARMGLRLRHARLALPIAALVTTWLVVRHFAKTAWPFSGADWRLVCVAGAAVVVSQVLAAVAWQRLFPEREWPSLVTLLTAVSAAAASGHVLPVQLGTAVKVGVVHRLTRGLRLRTVAVTIGALGVLNVAAILPLALGALAVAGLAATRLVAAAVVTGSIGALLLVVFAERIVSVLGSRRGVPQRVFAVVSAVAATVASPGRRRTVLGLLGAMWVVRTLASAALLASFGMHGTASRAILLVALAPVAAIIPSPSGTATSVSATAAILFAAGLGGRLIFDYALAASVLTLVATLASFTVAVACLVCSRSSEGAERRARLRVLVLAPLGAFRA